MPTTKACTPSLPRSAGQAGWILTVKSALGFSVSWASPHPPAAGIPERGAISRAIGQQNKGKQGKEVIVENSAKTKTYIEEVGNSNNEAVLLLHGIGADHKMWEPQLPVFAENGYYVLAPDLLGHGKSSKVNTLELSDWEDQINELLRHKNVSKCHLVGVSMGGVIAQSYAMNNPEKVSRLVLSDTFGELKTVQEKLLGFSQVVGFRIYKLLGGKMLAKGMVSAYKAPFAVQAKEYFSQVSLNVDFDQLILARKAINKIDAVGKIDGDRIPTLVLVGDQFGQSFVEINRKIANGIRGSIFMVLKNSMDPSNLVNPDDFNQVVLQFLQISA